MADKQKKNDIHVKNKKASYEYHFIDTFIAGIKLTGTEIKSVRNSNVSLQEAYCVVNKGEVYVVKMHIAIYEKGGAYNHEPTRQRKLLLHKREISKIEKALKDKGQTLIPTRMFVNDRGWAKIKIAIAKGKKLYDKRQDIKSKDTQRELDRSGY